MILLCKDINLYVYVKDNLFLIDKNWHAKPQRHHNRVITRLTPLTPKSQKMNMGGHEPKPMKDNLNAIS